MPENAAFHTANLVLTSQCNLRCGYCYQNDKRPGRMGWETMKRSLDMMLTSSAEELSFGFWGGEPLLEFPMIRRAVDYVERERTPTRKIAYRITTNGLLLDDTMVDFLAVHRFDTQLSFDGVRAAQDLRGKNTFDELDRGLDRIRRRQPEFYSDCLQIALTLTTANLRHLADSIDYFLFKGVRDIGVSPDTTPSPGWEPGDIDRLDEQMARVFESSVRHFRKTWKIPLSLLRKRDNEYVNRGETRPMCGVGQGLGAAIDINGDVHGCLTFVGSYQKFRSHWIQRKVESMQMGSVHDEGGPANHAEYASAAEEAEIFHRKERKYSSYGKCSECEYLDRCSVCPMSIGNVPENRDPDRVPDFPCAFNKVYLRYRDRFPETPFRSFGTSGPLHDLFAALEASAGGGNAAVTRILSVGGTGGASDRPVPAGRRSVDG